MWTCEYCGKNNGMYYKDQQLEGILCLESDCGRFNGTEDKLDNIYDSDL